MRKQTIQSVECEPFSETDEYELCGALPQCLSKKKLIVFLRNKKKNNEVYNQSECFIHTVLKRNP